MRVVLISLVTVLVVATHAAAQERSRVGHPDEEGLRAAIRARLDAYGRGDAAAWGRFVADDCLCSSMTKVAIVGEIAARPSSLKAWFGEITGLELRVSGGTAVARYRVTEYTELAGQRIAAPQWRVECYERREGKWLLIGGIDSPIPVDPPTARVDPKVYDELVGQYEYGPGVVDSVTREGDRLMVQPAGQAREELFAQDEATYYGKGQAWRMIFVRDEKGRVTSVRFRLNEQDLVGKRVR
jgi:hypothetical protein